MAGLVALLCDVTAVSNSEEGCITCVTSHLVLPVLIAFLVMSPQAGPQAPSAAPATSAGTTGRSFRVRDADYAT
jgi:hypothetical protein